MSSSSSAPKKVQNKKASTLRRGAIILPQSPYRVVTSSGCGVTTSEAAGDGSY